LLGLVLFASACGDEENGRIDPPCAGCEPASLTTVSAHLEGEGIPWRAAPAALALEPTLEGNTVDWVAPEHMGQDLVEVLVEMGGQTYVAARLEEGPYTMEPGMELVGLRAVRGERVGALHVVETDSSSTELRMKGTSATAGRRTKAQRSARIEAAGHNDAIDGRHPSKAEGAESISLLRFTKPRADFDEPEGAGSLSRLRFTSPGAGFAEPDEAEALSVVRFERPSAWSYEPEITLKQDSPWILESSHTHLVPSAAGLEGSATVVLETSGEAAELELILRADSIDHIESTPAHHASQHDGGSVRISFQPPLPEGTAVQVDLGFTLTDFEAAGIAPGDGGLGRDPTSDEVDLFFFTGRVPLLPAPAHTRLEMPVSLTLDLPAEWTVASNLQREDGEWLGWGPSRGYPALAAGAYEEAVAGSADTTVRALALPDEDGAIADLADYVASHAATLDFYRRWGEITQTEVSVAAVSAEHGGSATYGLVMVPDFIFHRDRTRARDFFLAHELSHQWWGAVVWPASSLDLWLVEGMADYSALRALEMLRGEDEAELVWQENLELLMHLMEEGYGSVPGRDVPVRPETTGELQDYVYYLKGSWVLRRLETLIGRQAMDAALASYFSGAVHATAGTGDFISAVHESGGQDLEWFWEQWLHGTGLPEIVYAAYVNPDDPADFEIVVTQVGDEPHEGLPWRLGLGLSVGEDSGWVCMTERDQVFGPAGLGHEGPLEVCAR
ncbi:MAG: M1 family metallopeptidase, partial [Myxococcota bacterium]